MPATKRLSDELASHEDIAGGLLPRPKDDNCAPDQETSRQPDPEEGVVYGQCCDCTDSGCLGPFKRTQLAEKIDERTDREEPEAEQNTLYNPHIALRFEMNERGVYFSR